MQQLALDFTHREENNYQSRKHLEENRERFSAQCKQVYDLLLSGVRLTVLSAITEYGISSLPRRILDLKEHFRREGIDVEIKDCWVKTDSKERYKEYYI
jgi:hypothetical protein